MLAGAVSAQQSLAVADGVARKSRREWSDECPVSEQNLVACRVAIRSLAVAGRTKGYSRHHVPRPRRWRA
jgi:hypothetical protein